jgi:hypothetical protein
MSKPDDKDRAIAKLGPTRKWSAGSDVRNANGENRLISRRTARCDAC